MNVSFVGRVGKEPEVKTSRSGNKYHLIRVCEDVYNGNGTTTPMWFNVMDMQQRNIHKLIHKGTLLHITGDLAPATTYFSKDNRIVVDMTVFANGMSFLPNNKQREDTCIQQQSVPTSIIEREKDPEMPF